MLSRRFLYSLLPSAALIGAALAACSQQSNSNQQAAPPKPAAQAPAANVQSPLSLEAVNSAQFTGAQGASAQGAVSKTPDPVLIRAEVLLDRAKFSPGVMDGLDGENFQNALKAFEAAHNLPADGKLDPQVWAALTADKGAALATYTITQQDAAGPWSPDVGEDFVKLSDEKATGYHTAQEMLAEKFHMDENLLKALNPGADFSKAGTKIVVANPGAPLPSGEVKRIEVDKAKEQVRAYDAQNRLLALFPATVGSTDRPSPVGTYHVTGVAKKPDYLYDPSKLTWGPKHAGKLHIPPGPNNPVGIVWIGLSAPDYGIHGSPDPRLIGKTASHGCVRLTNWDVQELATAVKAGVQVVFLGGGQSGSKTSAASSGAKSGSSQGNTDSRQNTQDSGDQDSASDQGNTTSDPGNTTE